MLSVAQKFGLLDANNTKAMEELRKYLLNFEILQTCFGEVEASLQDQHSRLAEVSQSLADINPRIKSLLRIDGVSFVSNFLNSALLSPSDEASLSKYYPERVWRLVYRDDGEKSFEQFSQTCTKFPRMCLFQTKSGVLLGGKLTSTGSASYQDGSFNATKFYFVSLYAESIFSFTVPSIGTGLVVSKVVRGRYDDISTLFVYESAQKQLVLCVSWTAFEKTPQQSGGFGRVAEAAREKFEVDHFEIFE